MADFKSMVAKKLETINQKKQENDVGFLPGLSRTETQISGREDTLGKFMNNVSSKDESRTLLSDFANPLNFEGTINGYKQFVGDSLNLMGGLYQRGESVIASTLIEAQKGTLGQTGSGEKILNSLTGERNAQLGDVIRNTDFGKDKKLWGTNANELIAKGVGFGAFAGFSNMASSAKLSKATESIMQAVKNPLEVGKQIAKEGLISKAGVVGATQGAIRKEAHKAGVRKGLKNRYFLKRKADQFSKGIDDAFEGIRSEFKTMYKKIGGNKIVDDLDEVQSIVDDIGRTKPDIIQSIKKGSMLQGKKPQFAQFVDSKKTKALTDDVNFVKTLQREVGRRINWKNFDPSDSVQLGLKDKYFQLGDVIAKNAGDNADDLLRLNAKFKDLTDRVKGVSPLFKNTKGITKTSFLKNVTKELGSGEYASARNFSKKFFTDGKEILEEVAKHNDAMKFQKFLSQNAGKFALGTTSLAAAGSIASAPIVDAIKDSTGSGGQSESQTQ